MNSNELREHIRRLNEQERIQHEIRCQQALARIRELREDIKYKNKEKQRARDDVSQ